MGKTRKMRKTCKMRKTHKMRKISKMRKTSKMRKRRKISNKYTARKGCKSTLEILNFKAFKPFQKKYNYFFSFQ